MQFFNKNIDFAREGKEAVNPMDFEAATLLHAVEPRHLSLGKLVNGRFELEGHFFQSELTEEMERDEAVLQTVAEKLFGGNALVKQRLHLGHHALFQSLAQTAAYALAAYLAGHADAEEFGLLRFGIVALQDAFDVEPRATAENGNPPATPYVLKSLGKVLLELIDTIGGSWLTDVNKMVGHEAVGRIRGCIGPPVVRQILARADGHAAKHLPRVGTDDFSTYAPRYGSGEGCFSCGCGAEYGEHRAMNR